MHINSKSDKEIDDRLAELREELDLCGSTKSYKFAQFEATPSQSRPSTTPGAAQPAVLLPYMILNNPPAYGT